MGRGRDGEGLVSIILSTSIFNYFEFVPPPPPPPPARRPSARVPLSLTLSLHTHAAAKESSAHSFFPRMPQTLNNFNNSLSIPRVRRVHLDGKRKDERVEEMRFIENTLCRPLERKKEKRRKNCTRYCQGTSCTYRLPRISATQRKRPASHDTIIEDRFATPAEKSLCRRSCVSNDNVF